MRSSLVLFACLIVVGCGSSDPETTPTPAADTGVATDATKSDAKSDTGATSDSSTADTGAADVGTAGVKCGSAVCPEGQVCCAAGAVDSGFAFTCATSCPDGGGVLACDGPEDCKAGASICCAEIDVTGTLPSCDFKSGVADCRATCTSNIPLSCPSKATVRPCHKASDCTESAYANCCEFESGGTSATFCANDTMKFLAIGCL